MTQREMIEEMYRILKGHNGTPGLCEQVRDNHEDIERHKKTHWKIWGLIITGLGLIVGGIQAIASYLKS